ncbi:MAG: sigma-70 family RNA polymerase sigma factor [Candidatus Dormibacterales bacterium]
MADQFESERDRLRAIAYRMLGSFSDADDAVQETWLRYNRAGRAEIENVPAWLTTVLTRVCLNLLESRRSRREDRLPEPGSGPALSVVTLDPESEALLADSIGVALHVVLDSLTPPERVAFVLHDLFSFPFEEIGAIMDRPTVSVRQLASRGRRRVAGRPVPDIDLPRQWDVVAAFFAAARDREFGRLLEVLDPEVVLRVEGGGTPSVVSGARTVAQRAGYGARSGREGRLALVNGSAGALIFEDGRLVSVMSFTVVGDRIAEIEILTEPGQLRALGEV